MLRLNSGYREVPAEEVERANAAQVLTAETEVFARPNTSFDSIVE